MSAACKYCYAESWAKRVGSGVWGSRAPRRFFSASHWRQPLRWNADAEAAGKRQRVFCASMADVFETRSDLDPWRKQLWTLIEATPWLDWLLLTKRPEAVGQIAPWPGDWPNNVWLGTTVESQKWVPRRLDLLLAQPASVRFLSCEPLLGRLDVSPWLSYRATPYPLDWVIAGGESGAKARPMHPDWVRSLRDQCVAGGVPFHFKQWGAWRPTVNGEAQTKRTVSMTAREEIVVSLSYLGKGEAGRDLDGRTWDELPRVRYAGGRDIEQADSTLRDAGG